MFDSFLEDVTDHVIDRAPGLSGGFFEPHLQIGRQTYGGWLESFHHRASIPAGYRWLDICPLSGLAPVWGNPLPPLPTISDGQLSPGDDDRCYEAGCDGYMTKPMDLDEMIRLVHSFANPPQKDVA